MAILIFEAAVNTIFWYFFQSLKALQIVVFLLSQNTPSFVKKPLRLFPGTSDHYEKVGDGHKYKEKL